VIYALLESESTTGAYRFTVQPGVETTMDVELTLFPRTEMRVVGIAPLTSMFLFDETNRGRLDDYRPEVHDSDGLQITSKSGEHIFRQLANPDQAAGIDLHHAAAAGLRTGAALARTSDFQDFEINTSGGRAPGSNPRAIGAPGAVELVEIPSGRESNDNIVAFWRPAQPLPRASGAFRLSHHLAGGARPAERHGQSGRHPLRRQPRRQAPRVHAGFRRRRRKIDGLRLDLGASAGKISNATLMSNGAMHGLRASFEIDPNDAD
jgi:glucans biosynthesis protein